jgi:hypothetical protein
LFSEKPKGKALSAFFVAIAAFTLKLSLAQNCHLEKFPMAAIRNCRLQKTEIQADKNS